MMLYDVFISHASEDKDMFVRPLAEELRNRRIEVWYDEFSLNPGDSLRRAIDHGLSQSRYGIVVLSPQFFRKRWSQWELDGLVQRQLSDTENVIIPIWHGITAGQVAKNSPALANIVAINSNIGISAVADRVVNLVHPQGSSLLIARDMLLDFGIETPVVTDDWWLEVVEASVKVFTPGKWVGVNNSWQFPIPPRDPFHETTGKRLAWTVLQVRWQKNARETGLSQITHPSVIHEFVNSQPGLREASIRFPRILMESAPQLLIPEFSGEFGSAFDRLLQDSVEWYRNLESGKYSGTDNAASLHLPLNVKEAWELQADKLDWVLANPPSGEFVCGSRDKCDSLLVLRHPYLERINPSHTAYEFFRSEIYDKIDFIAWFLSQASNWLPPRIRSFLMNGLKKWRVWPWGKYRDLDKRKDFKPSKVTGSLASAIDNAESFLDFQLTTDIQLDVHERLSFAASILRLPESGAELADRFFSSDWIQSWFERDFVEIDRRFKKSLETFTVPEWKDDFFLD